MISRSPFRIKVNNLPHHHLGQWLTDSFALNFRLKPAIDDTTIMLEVSPLFKVTDAKTGEEYHRFETNTVYSVPGSHSKALIHRLIHHVTDLSIDEFNMALQETKSTLAFDKKLEKQSFEEFEPHIIEMFKPEHFEKVGITPYWKKSNNNAENINDKIIAGLPIIPEYKQFRDPVTIEQEALTDCIQNNSSNKDKVQIVENSLDFYKQCFGELEKIDLTKLTEDQLALLNPYLNLVFNCFPTISNEVQVDIVYRATIIEDEFLENGKVRQLKFLTFPPLEIIKKRGKYNRASGPDRTVFYCSTAEQVAIRELRPSKGQRIIVSTWKNNSGRQLVRFPIVLTAGIPNELADRSNFAFEYISKDLDPILTQWMSSFLSFLAKEFIKETEHPDPKRFDYLFSSLFADRILQPFPAGSKVPDFDCIVYPSVAWNHIPDNLAIIPEVVSKYFVPVRTVEFEVLDTFYDKNISLPEYPVKLLFIRKAERFKNGRIIWNDDLP